MALFRKKWVSGLWWFRRNYYRVKRFLSFLFKVPLSSGPLLQTRLSLESWILAPYHLSRTIMTKSKQKSPVHPKRWFSTRARRVWCGGAEGIWLEVKYFAVSGSQPNQSSGADPQSTTRFRSPPPPLLPSHPRQGGYTSGQHYLVHHVAQGEALTNFPLQTLRASPSLWTLRWVIQLLKSWLKF